MFNRAIIFTKKTFKNFKKIKLLSQLRKKKYFKDLESLSNEGYYHNIKIYGYSAWGLFGRRNSAVSQDDDFYEYQWRLIKEWIKNKFKTQQKNIFNNKVFLELGPAEGFHTLKMFDEGAKFGWLVTPQTTLSRRCEIILKINHIKNYLIVSDCFPFNEFADNALRKEIKKCDLILCLGVIYHAKNVIEFLNKLISYEVPIIMEYAYSYPKQNEKFIPEQNNDQENGFMNEDFIYDICENNNLQIDEFEDYSKYCLNNINGPKEKYNRKMIAISKKNI